MRRETLSHQFVEFIPEQLQDGVIYISITFATATHKCCCGCGNEVVTPFSPTDWRLIFDGESVSVRPSIGNWNFPCRSHYWITNDRVRWAPSWSREQVRAGQKVDKGAKERYFGARTKCSDAVEDETVIETPAQRTIWERLKNWF